MSDSTLGDELGFCGKIPSQGDFIQRGLPVSFIETWNEWMRAALAVSREQLGESWLEVYLTSPIWHFALSSDICGQGSFAGSFIPSVDQVGRHYPFTMAQEQRLSPIQLWYEESWTAEVETLILPVLDEPFHLLEWYQYCCEQPIAWPQQASVTTQPASDTKRNWHIPLPTETALDVLALLDHSYRARFGRYSIWWTRGSALVAPCMLITSGLPQVSQFAAMLDGNWQHWGWSDQQVFEEV